MREVGDGGLSVGDGVWMFHTPRGIFLSQHPLTAETRVQGGKEPGPRSSEACAGKGLGSKSWRRNPKAFHQQILRSKDGISV